MKDRLEGGFDQPTKVLGDFGTFNSQKQGIIFIDDLHVLAREASRTQARPAVLLVSFIVFYFVLFYVVLFVPFLGGRVGVCVLFLSLHVKRARFDSLYSLNTHPK